MATIARSAPTSAPSTSSPRSRPPATTTSSALPVRTVMPGVRTARSRSVEGRPRAHDGSRDHAAALLQRGQAPRGVPRARGQARRRGDPWLYIRIPRSPTARRAGSRADMLQPALRRADAARHQPHDPARDALQEGPHHLAGPGRRRQEERRPTPKGKFYIRERLRGDGKVYGTVGVRHERLREHLRLAAAAASSASTAPTSRSSSRAVRRTGACACATRRSTSSRSSCRSARRSRSAEAGPMLIDGQALLVVGGASGLGEATARALHARGAHVVVADLDAARGEALVAQLGADRARFVARRRDARGARSQAAVARRRGAPAACGSRCTAPASGTRSGSPAAAARTASTRSNGSSAINVDRNVQRAALRRPAMLANEPPARTASAACA